MTDISALMQEYPEDYRKEQRRQYLFSYYRKAFHNQYLRSKKYITDTIIRCWYCMDMQEKAIQRGQFDTAVILADQVKECVSILKKYQDGCYFKKQAELAEQKKDAKGNPLKFIITEAAIRRAKAYPISSMHEFGRGNMSPCIFHQDNDPSMKYYPATNSVYCFGCHKAADAIDFYREKTGCTFDAAVRALQ